MGSGGDCSFYHDGSDSYISDQGTGNLNILSSKAQILNAAGNEAMAKFTADGAVELYHNNSLRFQTDSNGCTVHDTRLQFMDNTKAQFGTGGDFQIWHDGSHTRLSNATGNFNVQTGAFVVTNNGNTENIIIANQNGAVDLYYDNSKKLETLANGIAVAGKVDITNGHLYLDDNYAARFGTGEDLLIYHDGSHSYIKDTGTGELRLSTSQFTVQNAAGDETLLYAVDGGAVGLKHSDSLKLETTSSGVTVTGTVSDSKGNLRSIPSNAQSSAYVAVAADAGKAVYISTGGVTINNSVFSAGDTVTIINNSGSDQTITKGSGVTLYNTADATEANRTLAQRGMATIWFASASVAYISGAGLS